MSVSDWLAQSGAHHDLVEWARAYGCDFERAWNECPRGDWLLGLAAKVGVERPRIVLGAAACARIALSEIDPRERRPLHAIETAERWARGGVSDDECRALSVELNRTRVEEPALACALGAAQAALESVGSPEVAPASAQNAVQAAVMTAADCAMLSVLSYTQQSSATEVRAHIPFEIFDRARTSAE